MTPCIEHMFVVGSSALAVVVGVGLIGTGQVASALGSHGDGVQRVSQRTYVVRQGDTLWAIASRIAPAGDPRPVIQAIQDANGGRRWVRSFPVRCSASPRSAEAAGAGSETPR